MSKTEDALILFFKIGLDIRHSDLSKEQLKHEEAEVRKLFNAAQNRSATFCLAYVLDEYENMGDLHSDMVYGSVVELFQIPYTESTTVNLISYGIVIKMLELDLVEVEWQKNNQYLTENQYSVDWVNTKKNSIERMKRLLASTEGDLRDWKFFLHPTAFGKSWLATAKQAEVIPASVEELEALDSN